MSYFSVREERVLTRVRRTFRSGEKASSFVHCEVRFLPLGSLAEQLAVNFSYIFCGRFV